MPARWRRRDIDPAASLVDAAGIAAVVARTDGRLAFVSQEAHRLLATGPHSPSCWRECRLPAAVALKMTSLVHQAGRRTGAVRCHFSRHDSLGGIRHFEADIQSLRRGVSASVVFRDVTDQMSREAERDRLRDDTDHWRQEVRHRVRNTLHMLSALLHLQDQRAGAPDLSPHFEQVRGHILAMAQAHDTLEIHDGTPQVNIVACIRALHALACRAHGLGPDRLPLDLIDGPLPAPPSIDMAVPMALIVHEVFSLAANRVAQGPGPAHVLTVRLDRVDQCGEISVAMDGLCVDDGGLNTRMIEALARQLRAKIHPHPDRAGLTLRFSPS